MSDFGKRFNKLKRAYKKCPVPKPKLVRKKPRAQLALVQYVASAPKPKPGALKPEPKAASQSKL